MKYIDAEKLKEKIQPLYENAKNSARYAGQTGTVVSDIDEFDKVANEWADNAKYEVTTYAPDCRKSYVAELRIHDHLTKLGFVNNGGRGDYDLVISTLTGAVKHASISFEIVDMFSDDFKIQAMFFTNNNSFVDISADTYKEVIANIDSVVFSTTLVSTCNTLNVCEKIDDVDFSKYDNMLLKKVRGLEVQETSFKDYLIKTLEDTLNKLKSN